MRLLFLFREGHVVAVILRAALGAGDASPVGPGSSAAGPADQPDFANSMVAETLFRRVHTSERESRAGGGKGGKHGKIDDEEGGE